MTCIVGLIDEGKVYIGGDSAGAADDLITVRADEKVFVRGRWAAALKALVVKGIVAKGGAGRAGFKPRIREWVAAELAAHDPTDQETEATYQAALGRIAVAGVT